MTRLTITRIHPADAWYPERDEVIGLSGTLKGRIMSAGDKWYSFTIVTTWGDEIAFMYAQFERMKE